MSTNPNLVLATERQHAKSTITPKETDDADTLPKPTRRELENHQLALFQTVLCNTDEERDRLSHAIERTTIVTPMRQSCTDFGGSSCNRVRRCTTGDFLAILPTGSRHRLTRRSRNAFAKLYRAARCGYSGLLPTTSSADPSSSSQPKAQYRPVSRLLHLGRVLF
jgi:hypothetical protein